MERYIHLTIKMSLASVIAILLAMALNLEFAITAGILAVLSIQLTRRDSVLSAVQRFASTLLGLAISVLLFILLGFNIWVFAFFTMLFIFISFAINLAIGIVPTLVLVSHVLQVGVFEWSILFNSLLLMAIAIIVALLLNTIYPLNSRRALIKLINDIDTMIIRDLEVLSERIHGKISNEDAFAQHEKYRTQLKQHKKEAELIDKDILFDNDHRLIHYLNVRSIQMNQIDRMLHLISYTKAPLEHALKLAEYVMNLSRDVGHADKATSQRESLKLLLEHYRQTALPQSREEFEYRAILYQVTLELDTFLKEKIEFHQQYPNFKMKKL